MVSEISALAAHAVNASGLANPAPAIDFSNAIQLAQQNPSVQSSATDAAPTSAPASATSTTVISNTDIVVRSSHFSKSNTVVHKIFEQAQSILTTSDQLAQRSSTELTKTAGLENARVDTSLANASIGDLKQAFDFAIRTYFMSKVVSESSASLKSLWTAQ